MQNKRLAFRQKHSYCKAKTEHSKSPIMKAMLMSAFCFSVTPAVFAADAFINEIHYDNAGSDVGEAIEIAGKAGTDLSGWQVVLYNGKTGATYNSAIALSGLIPDQQSGYGTAHVSLPANGLQNGSPDGLALLDANGNIVEFLSYEGVVVATNGPANGLSSTDIGVAETSTTPVGYSLQFDGSQWQAANTNTFGEINTGQTFNNNGAQDNTTVTGACFNCPDLSRIANAAEFDDNTYYAQVFDAINAANSTDNIKANINAVISANHKQLSYSEVWTALTVTDEDPLNADNVILFYRGITKSKFANGSGSQSTNQDNWNREHTWAKSHGFPSSSAYAYTDIHHLRPTDISVNSSRGNLDFDNSDQPLAESPANRVDNDSFEPRDQVKGDVARIIFYMDTRYEGFDSTTPDLQVVDALTSTGEPKLGKLCTLLAWNEADPVDEFEQNRNNSIYEFQGNRNPFIDHPEWVSMLYSESCDGSNPVEPDPTDPVDPTPVEGGADLFFSEYIEGSGYNKAVEIYNPTNETISLANYTFKLYSNGSATATGTYALTGEILPNDVVVLGGTQITNDSDLKPYVDQFTSAVNFYGDDYIELLNGNVIIDNAGIYAVKQSWGANTTLVRLASVTSGDTDRTDAFDKAAQWESHPSNTFSFLGAHLAEPTDVDPGNTEEPVLGLCNDEADKIHSLQGNGFESPVVGETKTIEGVVTSIVPNLKGYFIQEEVSDMDADNTTSEGIFVYTDSIENLPVVGNTIRIQGTVKEVFGRTQLTASVNFVNCGVGETISHTIATLPVTSSSYLEALEGMLVSFEDTLSVSDTYNLARYGQLTLSKGRLIIPTNIFSAGSTQAVALAEKNSRNRIILDDMNNTQNPENVIFPAPELSYQNTLRLGDTVTGLTGVVDYSFSEFRILPTQTPQFVATNARTYAPEFNGAGSLKVASFNVLNYFNGDATGQGFPTSRGANTVEEFVRQSNKIVAALVDINADIVGLMEIENDGFGSESAIADLVNKLNAQLGESTYRYVNLNQPSIGSDEITVGFIYKPSTVSLVGSAITTAQSPFDFGNRQPLVQSFKEIANNEELTIAVNHFKSKGSCDSATGNNTDQSDGQGCWNELRTQAATSLVSWLNTNPTGTTDGDVLIIGDLNAYAKEDPINAITSLGYKNLVSDHIGVNGYSYSFGGEVGYLDHTLASSELATQVVDASVWHINADEPRIFDYNTEYKSTTQLTTYYGDDAYRASDHDPVIVLLNLNSTQALVGDFDDDNDIDQNDVRYFNALLRSGEVLEIKYDFNHDSSVNSRDVRAMMSLCTRARCAVE